MIRKREINQVFILLDVVDIHHTINTEIHNNTLNFTTIHKNTLHEIYECKEHITTISVVFTVLEIVGVFYLTDDFRLFR